MSLNAFVWASNLPLDIVGGTAYRVLIKYADRVDEFGRAAWYKPADLAEQLGCSARSVQRAIRELLDSGLITEGDQRFVKHIRGGNRPTVYDLNLRAIVAIRLPIEVDLGTTPVVTPEQSGGDNLGPRGTTPVVAHRTVIEPYKELSNQGTSSYDKSVTPRSTKQQPPSPQYRRFDPAAPRPQIEPRSPELDALIGGLEACPCPKGFGNGKTKLHWFPGTFTTCSRCGKEATDIAAQLQDTQQEISA